MTDNATPTPHDREPPAEPPDARHAESQDEPETMAAAQQALEDALGERQRRNDALAEAVQDSTGVKVPSYSVAAVADVSLFPGITNDKSNGHLATAAQTILRLPRANRPSPRDQD